MRRALCKCMHTNTTEVLVGGERIEDVCVTQSPTSDRQYRIKAFAQYGAEDWYTGRAQLMETALLQPENVQCWEHAVGRFTQSSTLKQPSAVCTSLIHSALTLNASPHRIFFCLSFSSDGGATNTTYGLRSELRSILSDCG